MKGHVLEDVCGDAGKELEEGLDVSQYATMGK